MVHILFKALREFQQCVHSQWETNVAYRHVVVQLCTAGVQNFVGGRAFSTEWCITMGVVPSRTLSVQALQDFPECVHSL